MALFFITLLFFHWFGDFLLQNDWMALNKSKSFLALSLHVLIYSTCITIGFLLSVLMLDPWITLGFFFINGISHFVIDAITSRINGWLWRKDERHYFFVSIGFDQLVHTSILLWSAECFAYSLCVPV